MWRAGSFRALGWLLGLFGSMVTMAWAQNAGPTAGTSQYLIGGPLAGEVLPLWPAEQGAPAGHPGAFKDILGTEVTDSEGASFLTAPEVQLYPGAVEHYRSYWFKYTPVRSFFDRQSQVKIWTAPNLPGATASQAEKYESPIYFVPRHKNPMDTGRKQSPTPVIRAKIGAPVFKLDLGELNPGVYAFRVVGAVETAKVKPLRLPIILRLKVNDGPEGRDNVYRIRIGYVDEFYSVAEFYFHADLKRSYQAELSVDEGSQVDLLIASVVLDDALAGSMRQTIKKAGGRFDPAMPLPKQPGKLSKDDRLKRDAALWNCFPQVNLQGMGAKPNADGRFYQQGDKLLGGTPDKLGPEIEKEFGSWQMTDDGVNFLVNKKLNLVYSIEDRNQMRPLPKPYPYPDSGIGLVFPNPDDSANKGRIWAPIGDGVIDYWRDYSINKPHRHLANYQRTGNADELRDAAITLARWAYAFPTVDTANAMYFLTHADIPYGRENRARRRETVAFYLNHYPNYVDPVKLYDQIYDYLSSDQELAQSIGRFIPWVKTPKDVIELFDVYLLQTTAKRILRYHFYTDPMEIANLAILVGDNKITDPWMDWLFSRTFVYPLPPSGIQDAMITGICRDGCEYIGSTYYAQGEGAARVGKSFAKYLQTGGNRKYDLTDSKRYPKPLAQCYWQYRTVVAGFDFLRIGDVCGPDKPPGHTLRGDAPIEAAVNGWQWSGDPQFAFVLKHYVDRNKYPELDWKAIDKAAEGVSRAPWLANRTRTMPMWATILEAGTEHDDYRFRRAAYLRTGYGYGHQHADTLDLQVSAHGLPATIDGGQRPGYAAPGDGAGFMHNRVLFGRSAQHTYSWTRTLTDAAGAPYAMVQANPPKDVKLYTRQIALLDVDEGKGSTPLSPALQWPQVGSPNDKLPKDVITPNSYVFDCFRVSGGNDHTYAFHAMINEGFEWNASGEAAVTENSPQAEFLKSFLLPELKKAGQSPAIFQATWEYARQKPGSAMGTEPTYLGRGYDEKAPRRYTRLHLLNVDGARAMRAQAFSNQYKYDYTMAFVQKTGEGPMESAFAAIIEPYVGKPFITDRKMLAVKDNETDALKAVAVAVKTVNGHTDMCFADGRPEKVRQVADVNATVSAEFAYLSMDARGLRQASITGGSQLVNPEVRLLPAMAQRTGKVTAVDYQAKTMILDQSWPQRIVPGTIEVGIPGHWTAYMTVQVQPSSNKSTTIQVQNGADYFRSNITKIDSQKSELTTAIDPILKQFPDQSQGWIASNDQCTKFWRADYLGQGRFKLTGEPISEQAFGSEGVMRLWEYGIGDQVRQSTFASIRRTADDLFELTADVDVTLALKGKTIDASQDGKNWESLKAEQVQGLAQVKLVTSQLDKTGRLWLRVR